MTRRPGPRSGLSRRETLAVAAAAATAHAGVFSTAPVSAQTGTSRSRALWPVVDPNGGGDFRTLAEAIERTPVGATILARAGIHEVDRPLRPRAGSRIVGEGAGTVIRGRKRADALVLIAEEHVSLENLRLDGDGQRTCVDVRATYARMSDCVAEGGNPDAVVCRQGAGHAIIRGCRIRDSAGGLRLAGSSHCTVHANLLTDVDEDGILLEAAAFAALVGNIVRGTGGGGIVLDGARDSTLSANSCAESRYGIRIGRSEGLPAPVGNIVSANVCADNREDGVTAVGPLSSVIADNTVRANGRDGIRITGANGCTVTGNTAHENQRAGVTIRDSTDCICTGNVSLQNGRDDGAGPRRSGVVLEGASSACAGNIVTGNRCSGGVAALTQLHGLALIGRVEGNLIGGNLLHGNEGAGMLAENASVLNDAIPWRRLDVTVGEQEAAIEHKLSYPPLVMSIAMAGRGQVWRSSPPDERYVYLTADAAGRRAQVVVG